ncbi:MAG: glycoside hydrolase family 88 protein, partial [Muribaculaceae bacterium]|nr:glycoside hydrolase family 88 protein [Muribaculaceae bacterium]
MNSISRILISALALCGMLTASAAPKNPAKEAGEVRAIIDKVNTHWQNNHKPEATPFWHVAAYHTGNMEAYKLTGNENYRDYSLAWADHNQWKGAKGNDRSKWKYDYGETDDHVLFGDWQICFQTYADLYNELPDDYKIRRAREVMEYEMSTPQNDYWWWADGLYMVMPVMTKLYNITGNQRYLDKLYEYVTVSDSIMLDPETGLYFRDGKYVYPKHKSTNGQKDFWARGDGWVLAGLAKVLADLPKEYKHRDFFEKKYVKMADAVVAAQQPEGYWTRSMLDPEHAPGPETSGTAFFTYGLLWGINNGYLQDQKYLDAALKGWDYLRNTALQKDGSVGYVQPIGEKAIPGQVVDSKSTSDFGVGAFLLAACEYVRFLEKEMNPDRAYWTDLAYKIAYPVLSNMAEGKLQANMEVEVSPNWDGRDKKVT